MKQTKPTETAGCWRRALSALCVAAASLAGSAFAHEPEPIEFSEIGIPYAWLVEIDDGESTHIEADHVGAWSWDEDNFPATARGWTHTSKWIKLDLTEPAALTLTLESQAGVPWPSSSDPARLAGTNLYPSFTLYRGWDTDAGLIVLTNGATLDQDHTFNNRGNIEWAEDVQYLDHLENSTEHSATRTWLLPAGHYTINLGGNSPATLAEGRQGYLATLSTAPARTLVSGLATIDYDKTAWDALASGFGPAPVLTLTGFYDQAAANALTSGEMLTNAQSGFSYTGQLYAMNGSSVTNLPDRTTQPTTFIWTQGSVTNHGGRIGLGGVARFGVFGGAGGNLLFGDLTLEYDSARIALGGSGWFLQGNIPPAAPVYDLLNVTVTETDNSLSIAGDLGITFEIANFLFSTPSDWLKDVGDFRFTGYTIPLTTPRISGVSVAGGNLVVRGASGVPGTTCVLQSASSVTAPNGAWTTTGTGTFDATGACSISVLINTSEPARFFRLRQP